jgi:hypothetical protein
MYFGKTSADTESGVQLEYQPAGKCERQPASLLIDTGGDSVEEALAFGEPLKDARKGHPSMINGRRYAEAGPARGVGDVRSERSGLDRGVRLDCRGAERVGEAGGGSG